MKEEMLSQLVKELLESKVNIKDLELGVPVFVVLPLKDDVATVEVIRTGDDVDIQIHLSSTIIDTSLNFYTLHEGVPNPESVEE